jgi:hypothetical protein
LADRTIKQKLFADVMAMLSQGANRDHVMNTLAPTMIANALRDRDALLSTVDSLAMDLNANVAEHSTIN